MLVVCIRTLVFFCVLWLLMRLMGKRQMGEVTVIEFVSAMMLSEMAVLPMSDPDVPLLYGVMPILLISSCEVLTAELCKRSRRMRTLLRGDPIPLVKDGILLYHNCARARISVDEIYEAMRSQGYGDLSEVSDVTLERTGRISVLPS